MLTIKKVELIRKKKFAVIALNLEYKIFILHITALNISFDICDKMHSSKKAQISHLQVDKDYIEVPSKYAYFKDTFLSKLAVKLPNCMSINNYAIKLIDDQQSFYSLI